MKLSISNFQFPTGQHGAGFLLCLAVALYLAGCANPVMPSGGPRDTTPPAIAEATPSEGATSVPTETAVRIIFTEYVDLASFEQALSVTPAFDEPPDIGWSGRTVEIEFPRELRDTTTYILTLDTDLQDARGVALDAPLTLAFSTGPTINRGRLSGLVVDAARGTPVARIDIYAYAAPDSVPPRTLPERPAYRTQTGSDGRFSFDYLREQPYYVIALRDLDRNRRPDPLEAFAVPPRAVFFADSTNTETELPWVAAVRDTLAPRLIALNARSRARLVARFNEPVLLAERDPSDWALIDSVAGAPRTVEVVYQREPPAPEVYLRTEALAPRLHRLTLPPGAVVDTSGNALPDTVARVTPPEAPDTLQTRFLSFVPADRPDTTALRPGLQPGVRFNQPVDTTRLRTLVIAQDTTGAPRRYTAASADGTTYRLRFTPPLADAPVLLRLDTRPLEGDTTYTRLVRRLAADALGELSGVVTLAGADTTTAMGASVIVQMIPMGNEAARPVRRTEIQPGEMFVFDDLPGERAFRFRVFLDRNGNDRWDAGRIAPYRPAEPITWRNEPVEVRARWETALPDTLRLMY